MDPGWWGGNQGRLVGGAGGLEDYVGSCRIRGNWYFKGEDSGIGIHRSEKITQIYSDLVRCGQIGCWNDGVVE